MLISWRISTLSIITTWHYAPPVVRAIANLKLCQKVAKTRQKLFFDLLFSSTLEKNHDCRYTDCPLLFLLGTLRTVTTRPCNVHPRSPLINVTVKKLKVKAVDKFQKFGFDSPLNFKMEFFFGINFLSKSITEETKENKRKIKAKPNKTK